MVTILQTDSTVEAPAFITATGGTETTQVIIKFIHLIQMATFTVSTAGTSAPNNEVSYLVVAGGGGWRSQQSRWRRRRWF